MKIETIVVKCAMCGNESEQNVLKSNLTLGLPDLDMRPTGSMASLSSGIQECPVCHYINFDISQFCQDRFKTTPTPLDMWTADEDIQNIYFEEPDEDARKCRIMAELLYGNLDKDGAYQMMVRSFWTTSKAENKQQYLEDSLDIFRYDLIENEIKRYIQLSDLSRQNKSFAQARNFIEAAKSLMKNLPEDTSAETLNFFENCTDFEVELIEDKDYSTHNLSEY